MTRGIINEVRTDEQTIRVIMCDDVGAGGLVAIDSHGYITDNVDAPNSRVGYYMELVICSNLCIQNYFGRPWGI